MAILGVGGGEGHKDRLLYAFWASSLIASTSLIYLALPKAVDHLPNVLAHFFCLPLLFLVLACRAFASFLRFLLLYFSLWKLRRMNRWRAFLCSNSMAHQVTTYACDSLI